MLASGITPRSQVKPRSATAAVTAIEHSKSGRRRPYQYRKLNGRFASLPTETRPAAFGQFPTQADDAPDDRLWSKAVIPVYEFTTQSTEVQRAVFAAEIEQRIAPGLEARAGDATDKDNVITAVVRGVARAFEIDERTLQ